MAIAYMEVGKGREQDAEALSGSDYLSLKYMDVLNAGAFFCLAQVFHKFHVQPIFLGLFQSDINGKIKLIDKLRNKMC